MRVFISWSGEPSKSIAEALGDWLPCVNQRLDTFVSSQDIEMGRAWRDELASQLAQTSCGVLCLTPTNVDSRWVLFEAGALSKDSKVSRVCPILFAGLTKTDVKPPLADLQLAEFNQADIVKVLESLNAALANEALKTEILHSSCERWWPDLELAVRKAEEAHADAQKPRRREEREVLEEILGLARQTATFQERALLEQRRLLTHAFLDLHLLMQSSPRASAAVARDQSKWDAFTEHFAKQLLRTTTTTPEPPLEVPESDAEGKGTKAQ